MESDAKEGLAGRSGSATDAKIRECAEWLAECNRQFHRGKPVLALGVVKCLQMSLEELAGMLGQPESPNAVVSDGGTPFAPRPGSPLLSADNATTAGHIGDRTS